MVIKWGSHVNCDNCKRQTEMDEMSPETVCSDYTLPKNWKEENGKHYCPWCSTKRGNGILPKPKGSGILPKLI